MPENPPDAQPAGTQGGAQGGGGPQVIDGNTLIQLSPAQLQQLLANASTSASSPKCPKFWEQEPSAWFMVFRGHYEGKNLTQLALFKALLPLLPALAVSLCRPLVTAPTPTVMDDAERLLLLHYELGPLERGRALVHCTSLGDRTPREMLQYMRSLQPGEPEGCLLYTSPSPRDLSTSRMPSSA